MNADRAILALDLVFGNGDRSYLSRIEDSLRQLAKRTSGVRAGIPSAGEIMPDKWRETYYLAIKDNSECDEIADLVVDLMHRVGIQAGYSVTLTKRVIGCDGEDFTCKKRIFPKRLTKWKVESDCGDGKKPHDDIELPRRIQYLNEIMQEYFGKGGKDVFSLLRGDRNVRRFWSSLPKSDQKALVKLHAKVVRRKDHTWINEWVASYVGEKVSIEREMAIYLLALLERLSSAGFIHEFTSTPLVDWNNFV